MNDILQKLRSDFEFLTGESYAGLVKSIGMGFASRLSEFNSKLRFVEKQAFVSTADKEYLRLHTGHLLDIYPATTAKGRVVFFGAEGATAPVGLEIGDETATYRITEKAVIAKKTFTGNASVNAGVVTLPPNLEIPSCSCIANGVPVEATSSLLGFSFSSDAIAQGNAITIEVVVSAPVRAVCLSDGKKGNREFSDELSTSTTIEGFSSASKVLSMVGGKDEEGVEAYRTRALRFLAEPQAPFNSASIRNLILDRIPSIKYAWVVGGEVHEGRVSVYLLNYDLSITEVEQTRAKELVESTRPPNMRPETITVSPPSVETKDVVIKDLFPADDIMKAEVKKNIEYLFATDLFETGVTKSNIESVVYRTVNGTQRVQSFTVQSGDCAKKDRTFFKLGTVTFS